MARARSATLALRNLVTSTASRDLPVQIDHQAALCLMVLLLENLMAPIGLGEQPVGPTGADFEFRHSPTTSRPRKLPANILMFL